MNKITLLTMLTLLTTVGCGQKTERVTVQGANGSDGYSIVSKTESNPELCGSSGGTMVILATDLDRDLHFSDGDLVQNQYVSCNGNDGLDGLNGSSCSVSKVGTSSTITCGSSSAVVLDGSEGSKGDKGDTGSTGATGAAGVNASGIYISSIINPCGEEFANDEVFLKLSNGRILALYDGGANEDRLTLIAPGSYITTDRVQNRACSFTVTSNYEITNQEVKNTGNN